MPWVAVVQTVLPLLLTLQWKMSLITPNTPDMLMLGLVVIFSSPTVSTLVLCFASVSSSPPRTCNLNISVFTAVSGVVFVARVTRFRAGGEADADLNIWLPNHVAQLEVADCDGDFGNLLVIPIYLGR